MKFHNILKTTVAAAAVIAFTSCSNSGSPDGPVTPETNKRTVLLYAVASNNLYSNLVEDKKEILHAAKNMDLTGLSFLVYQVTHQEAPQLLELKRINKDSVAFVKVKEYDRSIYSTNPARISEVIDDAVNMRKAENYGLILWSHATGLDYFGTSFGRTAPASSISTATDESVTVSVPQLYSFGMDIDKDKDPNHKDAINIDDLADAIPDNLFDFIWFDACLMSGIETIYELRDKCHTFVAYPTEVYTPGMPYHLTVPYILREKPDLTTAAEKFFNYYAQNEYSSYRVATVAVVDVDNIEPVADFCKKAYADPQTAINRSELLKYTRRLSTGEPGPFYDFGNVTEEYVRLGGNLLDVSEFNRAMERFVIYKASTPRDFNFNVIDLNKYSGIGCYLFYETDSSKNGQFYHQLDWYKRVYPQLSDI